MVVCVSFIQSYPIIALLTVENDYHGEQQNGDGKK